MSLDPWRSRERTPNTTCLRHVGVELDSHVSFRHVATWQVLTFEPRVRDMPCLVSFPWIIMALSSSSMVPELLEAQWRRYDFSLLYVGVNPCPFNWTMIWCISSGPVSLKVKLEHTLEIFQFFWKSFGGRSSLNFEDIAKRRVASESSQPKL